MPREDRLSFKELEGRLAEIPDGPSGILNTPKPYRVLNIIGGVAAAIALLPPLVLVHIMTPALWMVTVCQIGFAVMLATWLPTMVRSYAVLGWTLWRWRADQVDQLDHDLPHFVAIVDWLSQRPEQTLIEYQRGVRLAHKQVIAKIGLLAGGLDRLGILPVLASVYLLLRNWHDLLNAPTWQIGLGVLLILLYFIITAASLMRIRLQLYETLLDGALDQKRRAHAGAAVHSMGLLWNR